MENGIPVNQFLSDVGDGTGNVNANGDYSVTPKTFFIQPAATEIIILNELVIHIVNGGALPATVYGGLAGALTNGINVTLTNSRVAAGLILPVNIKNNADLIHTGGNFNLINFSGGVDAIAATIDFKKSHMPLILKGSEGHKLEVILTDNFTGLNDHHFTAKGYK